MKEIYSLYDRLKKWSRNDWEAKEMEASAAFFDIFNL